MPKNVIIAIVVILVVGGGAALLVKTQQSDSPQNPKGDNPIVNSLQDALTKAVSVTCDYTDAQGKQTKVFVKNGAVRSDIVGRTSQQSGSVIVKDKVVYFWNIQKQGFMMKIPEDGSVPKGLSPQTALQLQDMMQGLEQYKDSCKPGLVSDDVFVLPTDISFQDLSQMK